MVVVVVIKMRMENKRAWVLCERGGGDDVDRERGAGSCVQGVAWRIQKQKKVKNGETGQLKKRRAVGR